VSIETADDGLPDKGGLMRVGHPDCSCGHYSDGLFAGPAPTATTQTLQIHLMLRRSMRMVGVMMFLFGHLSTT
jgi:hypothetical protein